MMTCREYHHPPGAKIACINPSLVRSYSNANFEITPLYEFLPQIKHIGPNLGRRQLDDVG